MKQIFKIFSYPSKPIQTFFILAVSIIATALLALISSLLSWVIFSKITQIGAIINLLTDGTILLVTHYFLIKKTLQQKKFSIAQGLIQATMLIVVIFLVLLFEFTFNFK